MSSNEHDSAGTKNEPASEGVQKVYSGPALLLKDAPTIIEEYNPANSEEDNLDTHYIYVIADEDGFLKIGHSNNPLTRIKTLQGGNRQRLRLLRYYPMFGYEAVRYENWLHKDLELDHVQGEWFRCDADDVDEFIMTYFDDLYCPIFCTHEETK